jgi:hypothetical protein
MVILLARASGLGRSLAGLFWRFTMGSRASTLLALAPQLPSQLNGCGVLASGLSRKSLGLLSTLAFPFAGGLWT